MNVHSTEDAVQYKYLRIKELLAQLEYAKQIENPVMENSVKVELSNLGYEFKEDV